MINIIKLNEFIILGGWLWSAMGQETSSYVHVGD